MATITWLADVLRGAGLPVVEYANWKTRSAGSSFTPRAIIWHHDASAMGPSPGIPAMIADQGNSTTPPPLAHLWVDMFGTWTVIAGGGRANHAGTGSGWGVIPKDSGNQYAIGIETDHTTNEKWPDAQLNSLRLGTTALLLHMGADPMNALCGHKEYAPGRKVDPDGLDMNVERQLVADGPHRVEEDDVSWQEQLTSAYNPSYATSASDWLTTTAAKTEWTLTSLDSLHAKMDAIAGALSDDEAKIIAAVRAQPTQPIDASAVAKALAPLLTRTSDEQLSAVVAQLVHDVPLETRRLFAEGLTTQTSNPTT